MLEVVTSVLELAVVACVLGALVVTAVVLGQPWGWPIGLFTLALALVTVRVALRAAGSGSVSR